MSAPLSIRLDDGLAQSVAGSSTSALALRLIDEGLRMADHPGIIFKDGPPGRRVLLDEMFSPVIAAALRDLGHDVAAVAEQPALRAMTDEEVLACAVAQPRWLLTENVRDFQPILQQALQAGTP